MQGFHLVHIKSSPRWSRQCGDLKRFTGVRLLGTSVAHLKMSVNLCGNFLMERFGEKLRTLRTKHNMTVRELARALEYGSFSHISDLETGRRKPSLDLALKISRFFGVSTDQLLKDELELDDG